MAKKKAKKKSKAELKIFYKIVYQRRKALKIKRDIEILQAFLSEFKAPKTRLKIEAARNADGYIKEGKKYKHKSLMNAILNEGTKVQTELFKLQNQISKFRKVKSVTQTDKKIKGERSRRFVGFAWDNENIDNLIYKNQNVNTINGINIKKDKDKIDALINSFKLKMTSTFFMVLFIDTNGNGRLIITEDTDENEGENEI